MFVRRTPSTLRLLLATLFLGAVALSAPGAVAQEPDPAYDLTIGVTGEAATDIPSRTVNAFVVNADQTVDFGSCQLVTDAIPGGCTVNVPPGTTVVVEVDEAALPAGIVPVENPITYTTPAERTGAGDVSFDFVYADTDGEPGPPADPGEVSALPNTGAGRVAARPATSMPMIGASTVVAVSALAGGVIVRSTHHR